MSAIDSIINNKWHICLLIASILVTLIAFPYKNDENITANTGKEEKAELEEFLSLRNFAWYTVKSNDTLFRIAGYFRVPLRVLEKNNKKFAENPMELAIGSVLKIGLKKDGKYEK